MDKKLSGGEVIFMAVCTGLIVANIYYCQPLVVLISREFGVAETKAGMITFFTQAGYAAGLLFFVPLGDMVEKRSQIVITSALAVGALILAALAPSLAVLYIAAFLIGCTCIVPQLILPLAAHLSSPERRGRVIGTVMSGLLIGILLSRTLSGFIGDWLGWRSMFWIAAAITTLLLIVMRLIFPKTGAKFHGHYGHLMASLITLIREQPLLREATAINALTFSAFGLFWTTMVLHLANAPFHFQSGTIGLFGLAAAAGALVAPIVGGRADRSSPRVTIGYGLGIVGVSFIIFILFGYTVAGMIIGIVLLDLGQQSVHVSNQTRVYALMPEARNRLNTVYMTISFIGTSLGSAIGLKVWDIGGWKGVCIAGMVAVLLAFTVFFITRKKTLSPAH